MRKTMIISDNAAGHGKTQSIKAVFKEFKTRYPDIRILDSRDGGDIKVIFTINVKKEVIKIGLESQGDPNSRQPESLTNFANAGCDIIIGASRTRGKTVHNVRHIAEKFDYRVIWARNYSCYDDTTTHEGLIALYVDSIMKMVEEIIYNRL